jgi:hypothetical protein
MRPKARGLAQHGGPPGWLEETDPSGCDFVRDELMNYTTCPSLELTNYYNKWTQNIIMSYVTQGRHGLVF